MNLKQILFLSFALSLFSAVNNSEAAPSCFSTIRLAPKTAALRATASSAVLLDFDGDGNSDIVSVKESSSKTTFNIISSLNGISSSIELPAGKAVPADYDGDLKLDAAVVHKTNRGIKWTIKLSSSGEIITRTLGQSGSDVIYGCRFLSSGKYSLATFNNRKLQAIELGSNIKRTISFTELSRSSPIGCGDPTADGIDELIVQTVISDSNTEVSTVSCFNNNVDYGSQNAGSNLFVVDAGTEEIPIIGRLRSTSNKTLVRLNPLYDKIRYPHFYIPNSAPFSFGKFKSGEVSTLGILWQSIKSRVVTRQLFSQPSTAETVATLGAGEVLVKPQQVIQNRSID